MTRALHALLLITFLLACRTYPTQQDYEEQSQWSKSEMSDYRNSCVARQPQGVKPEEAENFCKCKTVGLLMHFTSPSSAERAVHLTDYDVAEFQRTGRVPELFMIYSEGVNLCFKDTLPQYGLPDVALDTGIAR